MEDIKNLTPEELVNLVKTWYDANTDKRSVVMIAGKEEDDAMAIPSILPEQIISYGHSSARNFKAVNALPHA